ncbi:MAG: PilW family protein [Proteobacteria bacterium]|nr:PilW family protein [Pseudomonadota bacterium]
MIAVLLGALVVAGLINVLIANRQAYHLQEANNYNQQNMRFAMDRIGWSLRMAGFWGGVLPTSITNSATNPPVVAPIGGCDAAWVLDAANGVYGYDGNSGAGGFPAALAGCVVDANYISGTDVLVVRYAGTDAVPTSGGTSGIVAGEIYLQAKTGSRGELFANAVPTDLPNSTEGVSTYPYTIEMYYLRPCSDTGTGTTCTAASDGGNPIPTLMRLRLTSTGGLISEPVVEGVEQLQFDYGIRTSASDPTPEVYEDAGALTAADWANVTAVRIGYVLRSQTRDTQLSHTFDSNSTDSSDASYAIRLSGNCRYTVTSTGAPAPGAACTNYAGPTDPVSGKPQQFVRTEMTTVVQVRNSIRGPSSN